MPSRPSTFASLEPRLHSELLTSDNSLEIYALRFKILMKFDFSSPRKGNIDGNKSSITNGICCSTNSKYTKAGRKNSNLSQQDFDKKPLNNNKGEHFDGIDQIIANSNVNTGTLKTKKSEKAKSKDRKKLHGSLPNHLDTDVDYEGSDDTNSSGESVGYTCPKPFGLFIRLSIRARLSGYYTS